MPREHRLAHLAGFVRYQLSGEPRLIGSTIEVPALCRNGSTIRVALTLTTASTLAGKRVFRATLVPADPVGRAAP